MERYGRIRELADRGELSHAWLVFGEDAGECGRLAVFIASAMLCSAGSGRPCGVCPHCRKVADGIHPDLIRVSRLADKREILVEQARAVIRDAYVRPNEAARKVFIIEQADLLNSNAQNTMLKVIEEPPGGAAFIFVCRNPGALYDTIRSRCVEISAAGGSVRREFSPTAQRLADAVIASDMRSLVGACVAAEKLDRAEFDAMLDELYALFVLRARSEADRSACIAAAGWTDELRLMRKSNVSAGHCMGYLLSLVK